MPRFYFHIVNNGDVLTDDTAVVLPDAEAASREAEAAIKSYVRDTERGGPDYGGKSLLVVSEDNRVSFNKPIPVTPKPAAVDDGAPVMPASIATHRPGNMHGAGGLAQPLPDKDE